MQTNFKRKEYRNKKILESAKGELCLVNLPGCTGGGSDTISAHSNCSDDGKGISQKADDCFVAFACHHCHDVLDGRKKIGFFSFDMSQSRTYKEALEWYHDRGIKRTIRRLIDKGVLK